MNGTPPSEGERRALGGYVPQYLIASRLVLNSLKDGDFEWIRLVDPEARRLDDVQIGTASRVDAYQIKWSSYTSSITFRQLTQEYNHNPSLIRQLANGWQRLRPQNQNKHVVVHLLTNGSPSTSTNIGNGTSHFAAFIRHCWLPQKTGEPIDSTWYDTWKDFRKICNLPVTEFDDFVQACEFDFGFEDPLQSTLNSYQDQLEQDDLERLSIYLFEQVARSNSMQPVHLTRRKIIDDLGWSSRFEYRNRHWFPLDDCYVPIQAMVDEFSLKIENTSGGYLAVVGSAGSGKSSFLTWFLDRRPERVIKYYAYVPDDENTGFIRGESLNFFADINIAIQKHGITRGHRAHDVNEALQRFHQNLGLLSQNWKDTGVKTIILIDGLDHVPREQSPARTFLSDLPVPNLVPEGVYIILGTRDDQLADLRYEIRQDIERVPRRIEMKPLLQEEVMNVLAQFSLPIQLTVKEKQKIFELSEGHPLALNYIMRRFDDLSSQNIQEVLQNVPKYEGDIRNEYRKYWDSFVRQNPQLKNLLAYIARMRRAIDIDWLETHFSEAVEQLVETSRYFFRNTASRYWQFHHSSFRVFLEYQTALSISGEFNEHRDKNFHQQLADLFASTEENHFYGWEQIYHYVKAGNLSRAVEIATSESFEDQLTSFRPINSIQTDIRHVLDLVTKSKDAVALTRLILTSAEFEQRGFHSDEAWLANALLELGYVEIAISHIRQGQVLVVKPAEALKFASHLWGINFREDARFIFSLAEPINVLSSEQPISSNEDFQGEITDLLRAWSSVAIYFHSIEQIIVWIRNLRREAYAMHDLDEEKTTQLLHAQLFYDLGRVLLKNNNDDDFERILSELNLTIEDEAFVSFWLHHKIYTDSDLSDNPQTLEGFSRTQNVANQIDLSDSMKLALAEDAYRIANDSELAQRYLEGVSQPPLQSDLRYSDIGIDPFEVRFRLNRLLYALGHRTSLTDLVPDSENERDQGLIFFERGICALSHIWAKAWLGIPFAKSNIHTDLRDWIRFYYREPEEIWTNWYIIQGTQSEFFSLMIDTVAQHGNEVLHELFDSIVQEWEIAPEKYWPLDVKRSIILDFVEHDLPIRSWAIEQLNAIELMMYQDQDISAQIDACKAQFDTWIAIGDSSKAEVLLKDLLARSFGVGYRKDYQLSTWIQWLNKANIAEPSQADKRIKWFAEVINTLDRTTEGRASYRASRRLITVAYERRPSLALALFRWLIQQRIITHEAGIAEILKRSSETDDISDQWLTTLIGDFLLRFTDQDDLWDSLEEAITSIVDARKIEYLVKCVETYALVSHRRHWRHIISKATIQNNIPLIAVGLNSNDLIYSESGVSEEHLRLSDGTTILMNQLKNRVIDMASLQHWLRLESENSRFDWSEVIDNIANLLSIDEIKSISHLMIEKNKEHYSVAKTLALLTRLLKNLGDARGSWEMGLLGLKYASGREWYSFYSSSRLEIFSSLREINGADARSLAWDDFQNNVIRSDIQDYYHLITNLDDILDVLCESIPITEVWHEIESYVRRLMQTNLEGSIVDFEIDQVEDTSLPNILAEIIVDYLGHPVQIVAQSSAYVCGKMILRSDHTIIDVLKRRYDATNDIFQMDLVSILHAVALQNPDSLDQFRVILESMYRSKNLFIRNAAMQVMSIIKMAIDKTEPYSSLPPIYSLAILEDHPLSYEQEIPLGGTLPDSRYASEILNLYEFEILEIARISGFPAENIRARVVQIMNELQWLLPWKAVDESDLRESLQQTGLRLTYTRPRQRIAHISIGRAIGELCDTNKMPMPPAKPSILLNFYDPKFILLDPQVRPDEIKPILGEEQSRYSIGKDWKDEISGKDVDKILEKIDERIVLGESTELSMISDGNPKEIRQSQIFVKTQNSDLAIDSPEKFFSRTYRKHYSEYEEIISEGEDVSSVVYHMDHIYISKSSEWLAFNPMIAKTLNWILSNEGLFRWVNHDGAIMVESLHWTDSTLTHGNRSFEEVGCGWLVVASPDAWKLLNTYSDKLTRYRMVEKQYYVDRHFTRNYRIVVG